MKRFQANSNLAAWTEAEIREVLAAKVAALNASRGAVSDIQVGNLLALEMDCKKLGNEIRRRSGRPLLA